ncbi:MAG: nicotinate (nicotinamide) nucleotide adenylyltransferase [Myxococcales bacterium]|nr:nicotinate (nicotinamide) nucleotide adenylyltransferase [Myxococcales bacterium]
MQQAPTARQGGGGTARLRVAIFGGSFNPPHVGHVLAAAYVLSSFPVDALLVVPVFRHPFAKELAPYDARLAMAERAMGWLPGVTVSTIEREIGGESRTLFTVRALAERHPDWELRLVIGADVLADLPNWHRFDEVAALARPLVVGRAGVVHPDAPRAVLPAVSSTEVRALIARGDWEGATVVVPRAVLEYVRAAGLYRAATDGAGG